MFEHGFFTVSEHYAHLAIEAAVRHRWIAALPERIVVEHVVKHKTDRCEMPKQMYDRLRENFVGRKWHLRDVKVEGRPFPASQKDLAKDLWERKIITKWQQRWLGNASRLRNSFSHREFATVVWPSPTALKVAAEYINYMFDSVKPASQPINRSLPTQQPEPLK
jgi:hypothetical protein